MTETKPSQEMTPDTDPERSDIVADGWIDRFAPKWAKPYLILARVDRPIGTWLLLWPCLWSVSLASPHVDSSTLTIALLFAVGAFVMRGAGCTYNDIIDRDFDAKVARTALRPIPSGAVSVRQAVTFLALQLLIAFIVLLQLNLLTIGLGVASLLLVVTYPFMKRITYWPQAWLGLTFNWGAIMGWTAVSGTFEWPALALYAAGFCWTLGYDTIYAHQDKEDDALIGVKSTALKLGHQTLPFVIAMYGLTIILVAVAIGLVGFSWISLGLLALAALQLTWQAATLDIDDAANCLARFKSNRDAGLLIGIALLAVNL